MQLRRYSKEQGVAPASVSTLCHYLISGLRSLTHLEEIYV
ncbi:hypothetical protein C5167_009155 [Papaver somniferum]|uniref:Uncharacterized protein n=1 Tax=Papaver somniferum TaxID=3469 RepID=A0A4Y7K0H6_PAPSO|nr:hypothetical protein C5167_009155 [Papaver somniferum]